MLYNKLSEASVVSVNHYSSFLFKTFFFFFFCSLFDLALNVTYPTCLYLDNITGYFTKHLTLTLCAVKHSFSQSRFSSDLGSESDI